MEEREGRIVGRIKKEYEKWQERVEEGSERRVKRTQ